MQSSIKFMCRSQVYSAAKSQGIALICQAPPAFLLCPPPVHHLLVFSSPSKLTMSANTDPPPGSNSTTLHRGAPLLAARFDHLSVQKATIYRIIFIFRPARGFMSAQRILRHRTDVTHHLPAAPSTHQSLSVRTGLCISLVQLECLDGLAADRGGNVSSFAQTHAKLSG